MTKNRLKIGLWAVGLLTGFTGLVFAALLSTSPAEAGKNTGGGQGNGSSQGGSSFSGGGNGSSGGNNQGGNGPFWLAGP